MKYLKQFAILLACLFIGSIIKSLVPLPIPETIYGMVILFLIFIFKLLKPDDIRITANAILDNMAILFVPAGVGIIEHIDLLKENIVAIFIITFLTAIIAMIITMILVKKLNKRENNVL